MANMTLETVLSVLFIHLALASLSLSSSPHASSTKKTGCFKLNSCKCVMKDGTGVINLKAMGDPEGFLGRLKPVPSENAPPSAEILLSFSPCQPFSEPVDLATDCTNVAACLIIRFHRLNRYISRYIDYGQHEGNEFHYNHSMKTLSVSYFGLDSEAHPVTIVHYHCSPNESVSFIQAQSFGADRSLQIWVESPCACANACAMGDLGPGTIFLIILALSATAYFILGSCALRPFRNSSGVQIAPEDSVWCMPCYLVTEEEKTAGGRRKRYYSMREETL